MGVAQLDGFHHFLMIPIAHSLACVGVEIATEWEAALLLHAPVVAFEQPCQPGLELRNRRVEKAILGHSALNLIAVPFLLLECQDFHFVAEFPVHNVPFVLIVNWLLWDCKAARRGR